MIEPLFRKVRAGLLLLFSTCLVFAISFFTGAESAAAATCDFERIGVDTSQANDYGGNPMR